MYLCLFLVYGKNVKCFYLGNRPHPASKEAPFKTGDARLRLAIDKLDPRIHFALVCGAKVR